MPIRFLLDDKTIGATVTGAAARNEILRSDAVGTSPWVVANSPTITTGLSGAPNGSSTAMLMKESASSAHCNFQQPITVSIGQLVTLSISVKKYASTINNRYLALWLYQPGTTGLTPGCVINPNNGQITLKGAECLGVFVETQNDSWYRLSVTVQSAIAGTAYMRCDARSESYKTTLAGGTVAGDNTSGLLLWRASAGFVGGPVGPILTTTAAVAGDGWSSTLPPSNVLLAGKTRVARSNGFTGGVVLLVDFVEKYGINLIVIGDHNLSTDAVLSIELWSGVGQTGSLVGYISPNIATNGIINIGNRGLSASYLSIPVQARSIRITIKDQNNSDGYIQIGRLMSGQYIEPMRGIEVGCAVYWSDLGYQSRQFSGALISSIRAKYKSISGDLSMLSETERSSFHKMFYSVGTTKDIFASVWPNEGTERERDYQIIGRFSSIPKPKGDNAFSYSTPFEIIES